MQEPARRLRKTISTTKKAYNQKPFFVQRRRALLFSAIPKFGIKTGPHVPVRSFDFNDSWGYLKLTPQLEFALTFR